MTPPSDAAAADPVVTVIDLDAATTPPDPIDVFGGVVVGTTTRGELAPGSTASRWADRAAFTLTETPLTDPQADDERFVLVESVDAALRAVHETTAANPIATAVCDDVLRANAPGAGTCQGLTTESLAYSTLQGGAEFAAWLASQGPRVRHEQAEAVTLERTGDTLAITSPRT